MSGFKDTIVTINGKPLTREVAEQHCPSSEEERAAWEKQKKGRFCQSGRNDSPCQSSPNKFSRRPKHKG